MDIKGFQCVELTPGANAYVVPKEEDPGAPQGFADTTVRVYRLNEDGTKGELLRTMDPFPEGWDSPNKLKDTKMVIEPKGEDQMITGKSNIENWPEIIARGMDLLDTGLSEYKVSAKLIEEFKLPVTRQNVYQKLKKAVEEKSKELQAELEKDQSANQEQLHEDNKTTEDNPDPTKAESEQPEEAPEGADPRKAATINEEFDRQFPPMGSGESVPHRGAPFDEPGAFNPATPVQQPLECALSKEDPAESIQPELFTTERLENLGRVKQEGNSEMEDLIAKDEKSIASLPVDTARQLQVGGPTRIRLITTILDEYRGGAIDDQLALSFTRGILDLQLPEVG